MALSWKHPAVVTALGALALGSVGFTAAVSHYGLMLKKEPIYPADGRLLITVPTETPSWKLYGPDYRENAEVEATLGTSNYISRRYVEKAPAEGARPREVDFHAAYYTGMIDTVPHVPDRCFVGGGLAIGKIVGNLPLPLDQELWREDADVPEAMKGRIVTMRSSGGVYVRLPRDPAEIRLRTMQFLDRDGKPFYAGYFFIANGGTVAQAEQVRLLAFDLKTRYAYYLKLQFTSHSVSSGEELAALAANLLNEVMPEVMLCVPDWVEVQERDELKAESAASGK